MEIIYYSFHEAEVDMYPKTANRVHVQYDTTIKGYAFTKAGKSFLIPHSSFLTPHS